MCHVSGHFFVRRFPLIFVNLLQDNRTIILARFLLYTMVTRRTVFISIT